MTAAAFDPYARVEASGRFLYALNPLAKLLAPLPAMLVLVFVRDLMTPLVFLVIAYVVLLAGARLTARIALVLAVVSPFLPLAADVLDELGALLLRRRGGGARLDAGARHVAQCLHVLQQRL